MSPKSRDTTWKPNHNQVFDGSGLTCDPRFWADVCGVSAALFTAVRGECWVDDGSELYLVLRQPTTALGDGRELLRKADYSL